MKVLYYDFHNSNDDADSIENPYNVHDSDNSSDHGFPGFNTGVRDKKRESQDPCLGKFSLNSHL